MMTKTADRIFLQPADLTNAKWGWALRHLKTPSAARVVPVEEGRPGDVIVARVHRIGHHTRLMTSNGRTRLYEDDVVVGVLGHRYATDAFEAHGAIESGHVDVLTNAGMLGRVRARHASSKAPTCLEVIGQLVDDRGRRLNLIDRGFAPRPAVAVPRSVTLVLGTGMNAGKTTSAARLVRQLMAEGRHVAALKVTGSVCPNDAGELAATGAPYVRDFSDYGFPSTYLLPKAKVKQLFFTMVADAVDAGADAVVVELADGVLQRETAAMIADADIRACCAGALLAAPCALSAMMGVEVIHRAGLDVVGVTGLITNAPLFVREFSARSPVPVLSSARHDAELGRAVVSRLGGEATRTAA